MRIAKYIVPMTLLLTACPIRSNGFGDPPDSGDVGGDVAPSDMGDTGPTQSEVGELCAGPADCVDGALCIGDAAGEFRCMAVCPTSYEICEDGAVCLPVMTQDASICYIGGQGEIADTCVNNLSCDPGLLCFGASSEFYCRTACDEMSNRCAPGEYCLRLDSGAGLCRSLVGSACVTSGECSGLGCSTEIAEVSGMFPGGYCTTTCTTDADCTGTSVCRTIPQTSQSVCVQTCEHRSECRFNGQFDCMTSASCGGSSDPDACRAMFGDESLCVPGPF